VDILWQGGLSRISRFVPKARGLATALAGRVFVSGGRKALDSIRIFIY
jgi:hypothetical protein